MKTAGARETKSGLTDDGLASIQQGCEFLNCSRQTLYNLMSRNLLPYVKFGSTENKKSRRIPWKALHEFAERSLVGA
jgi:excisionase family DNA binding protein